MQLKSFNTQLSEIIKKFVYKGFNLDLFPAVSKSKTADYQSSIPIEIYNYHKSLDFKEIENGITPKMIAQELIDITEIEKGEFTLDSDQFGNLQIKLKNQFLEGYISQILNKEIFSYVLADSYLKNNLHKKIENIGIIFPITDLFKELDLTDFRQWNRLESIARINQMFGNNVKRIHCISNNLPFHGILLSYLCETKSSQPLDTQSMAQFLSKKHLKSEEDIVNFGTLSLSSINVDPELNRIYEEFSKMHNSVLDSVFVDMSPKCQKVNSQALRIRTTQEIVLKLCKKLQCDYNIFSCETFESVKYQSFIEQNKNTCKLRVFEVGAVNSELNLIQNLKQINSFILKRIKNNIPSFDAQIETGLQKRWLRYYLNTFDPRRTISNDNQNITNLMFTKGEQRQDLYLKEKSLVKEPFKIKCQTDREIALTAVQIGKNLEDYNLQQTQKNINKLQKLVGRSYKQPNLATLRIIMQKYYSIVGLL